MNLNKRLAAAALLGLVIAAFALPSQSRHKSDVSKAQAAVKITRLDERSGGSGVVLESSETESTILTNNHVCSVAEHGGIVSNSYHRGFVTSFTRSNIHDLCLIKTSTNFEVSTAIANSEAPLTSTAAVSGFPRLQPNIITRGSFGEHEFVSIMTGIKPCTPEDLSSGDAGTQLICMFLGGYPIIRTYEAQFTGATIQAGNSGSAVYNEDGELSGLVFAGSGDFGYSLIVPQSFVYNFINKELNGQAKTYLPDTTVTLDASTLSGSSKFNNACRSLDRGDKSFEFLGRFCKIVSQDLIYNKN